jgi:hypothetical protein
MIIKTGLGVLLVYHGYQKNSGRKKRIPLKRGRETMKPKRNKYNSKNVQIHPGFWVWTVLFFLMFQAGKTLAQDTIQAVAVPMVSANNETTLNLFGGEVTNKGVGGVAVKFSSFNDQFAVMTGGRGAITINKKFTIGGGGYGIANTIHLASPSPDTTRIFKMGYGGLELGYVFYPGKKVNIGATLLFAAGASFWQNNPKSTVEELFDEDFKIFPVFEPAFYGEFALSRIMRLHTGVSYRYINSANVDYITNKNMRGFSGFVALLFGRW